MNEQLQLAIPEPSLFPVDKAADFADTVERWTPLQTDPDVVVQAQRELAAIEAYLRKKHEGASTEIARATRRLEIRIGELLGPAQHGGDRRESPAQEQVPEGNLPPGTAAAATKATTPKARTEFRKMAAAKDEPEVAAAVDAGASRAEVVRRAEQVQPRFKGASAKSGRPSAKTGRSSKIQPPNKCPMCNGTGIV